MTASQLQEALNQLADSETTELPFQLYDCREDHELELYDLAEEVSITNRNGKEVTLPLPKVNLDLYELQTGYFLQENFKKD